MDNQDPPNSRLASTRWRYTRVKIAPAPQAKSDAERSESSLGSLLRWPRKRPMHWKITYRGGPECWYEIEARGRKIRRPGSLALHDVMREIARWD